MKGWRVTLMAAAAVLALQACDQSAPVTTVQPPQASLPEDAVLRGDPASQAATAPPADSLATDQAVVSPPADGTSPQLAGSAPPPADLTQPPTSAMGAPGDPNAVQAPAGASTAPMGTAGSATQAQAQAPGGQGTAAMTEMWQAFPPGGGTGSTSQQGAAPAGTPQGAAPAGTSQGAAAAGDSQGAAAASPPQKVSRAELPRVRNPGDGEGAQLLAQRQLAVPVSGIAPTALADNYEQSRGSRRHEAIDILAPAGTPVVAVDDGRIAKLFTSKPGGLTVYQFDPQARLAYYYAHLQGYAQGLREGQDVRRGDLIGYVGSTGNADVKAPHLHFAVFRLGTPPKWWQGEAVNPYPALYRAQTVQLLASR